MGHAALEIGSAQTNAYSDAGKTRTDRHQGRKYLDSSGDLQEFRTETYALLWLASATVAVIFEGSLVGRGASTPDWRNNLTSSAGTGAVPPSTGPVQDNPAAQTQNLLSTDNLQATMTPGMNPPSMGVQSQAAQVPGGPPKPTSGAKMGKGF